MQTIDNGRGSAIDTPSAPGRVLIETTDDLNLAIGEDSLQLFSDHRQCKFSDGIERQGIRYPVNDHGSQRCLTEIMRMPPHAIWPFDLFIDKPCARDPSADKSSP